MLNHDPSVLDSILTQAANTALEHKQQVLAVEINCLNTSSKQASQSSNGQKVSMQWQMQPGDSYFRDMTHTQCRPF